MSDKPQIVTGPINAPGCQRFCQSSTEATNNLVSDVEHWQALEVEGAALRPRYRLGEAARDRSQTIGSQSAPGLFACSFKPPNSSDVCTALEF
jgi:hypothetical protein